MVKPALKAGGLPLLVNSLHYKLLMCSKRQFRDKFFGGFTIELCCVAFWSLNCECELMQKQRRIFNYLHFRHKVTCLGNRDIFIHHFNVHSKHCDECKFVLKFIQLATIFCNYLFAIGVAQKCQLYTLGKLDREKT